MNSTAKAHEPTMEEILASIRRIIADDEAGQPRPALRAVPSPSLDDMFEAEPFAKASDAVDDSGDDEGDILELTDLVARQPAAPLEPPPLKIMEPAPAPPLFPQRRDEERAVTEPGKNSQQAQTTPAARDEGLISREAGRAVASAFGSLNSTVVGQQARTIEDLVQDMLRPMLKDWLDDNLPALVERLVRAEIERVSRGPQR
jgi:uncharacterized protein